MNNYRTLFCFVLCMENYLSAKIRVNIVTIGNIHPNVPGAIPYTGPAIETGIQDIQLKYEKYFQFTHTYLFDRRMTNCVEFATNSDVVAGQWYYSSARNANDLVIFLFAGKNRLNCSNRTKIYYLLKIFFSHRLFGGISNKSTSSWMERAHDNKVHI